MASQDREELLRKVDIVLKDLIPNGGLLNKDQQTRFVEALKKDPWTVRVTLWIKWWFKRLVYILYRR